VTLNEPVICHGALFPSEPDPLNPWPSIHKTWPPAGGPQMVSEWSPKIDVTSGCGAVKGGRGGERVAKCLISTARMRQLVLESIFIYFASSLHHPS
jgi:hypothetical protein